MMEASSSTTAAAPAGSAAPAATAKAPAAKGEATAPAGVAAGEMLRQFSSRMSTQLASVQMPKALKDRTDELERRISATDIARINGYMRLVNLVFGLGLWATCFFRMFMVPDYSHFLVCIYIMLMTAGLVFIENHERFPSLADRVKTNFAFMFSAFGKASYIMCIAFLAFSQGWIGCILGGCFLLLALFNFFIIYRHPAYKAAMLQPTGNSAQQQEEADLEAMPELRYNQPQAQAQAQVPAMGTASATAKNPPAHVSV